MAKFTVKGNHSSKKHLQPSQTNDIIDINMANSNIEDVLFGMDTELEGIRAVVAQLESEWHDPRDIIPLPTWTEEEINELLMSPEAAPLTGGLPATDILEAAIFESGIVTPDAWEGVTFQDTNTLDAIFNIKEEPISAPQSPPLYSPISSLDWGEFTLQPTDEASTLQEAATRLASIDQRQHEEIQHQVEELQQQQRQEAVMVEVRQEQQPNIFWSDDEVDGAGVKAFALTEDWDVDYRPPTGNVGLTGLAYNAHMDMVAIPVCDGAHTTPPSGSDGASTSPVTETADGAQPMDQAQSVHEFFDDDFDDDSWVWQPKPGRNDFTKMGKPPCWMIMCVCWCVLPTLVRSEGVLLEKNIILVRQSFNVMQVRVALVSLKEDQQAFAKIADKTGEGLLRDLRQNMATLYETKIGILESSFRGMMEGHGEPMKELTITYNSKVRRVVEKVVNRVEETFDDYNSLAALARQSRGLFNYIGRLAETLIGTPSAKTQHKTEEMLDRLRQAEEALGGEIVGIIQVEKEHGDMIASNQLSLVKMEKEMQSYRTAVQRQSSLLLGLVWTLRFQANMNDNLWAMQAKEHELLAIFRSGKLGRPDENLFSPAETYKILLRVEKEAAKLGGQSVYGTDTLWWLQHASHVLTSLTPDKITQTVRFPVVNVAEVYMQKKVSGWPPAYLHKSDTETRMYLELAVEEHALCEEIGEKFVCALRAAKTWHPQGGAYIVEIGRHVFQYDTRKEENITLQLNCRGEVARKTALHKGSFDLHAQCSASVSELFAVAQGPPAQQSQANVDDGIKFHFDTDETLLRNLPPVNLLIQQKTDREILQLDLLTQKILANHTRLANELESSREAVEDVKGNVRHVESAHGDTRIATYVNSSAGVIFMIFIIAVIVCCICMCIKASK